MRAYLASSIGVACGAALLLPCIPAASADSTASQPSRIPAGSGPADSSRARGAAADSGQPSGGTQSLSLGALQDRATGDRTFTATAKGTPGPSGDRGAGTAEIRPFSLLGVVWDDPEAGMHDRLQVRTRGTGSDKWSGWKDLDTHTGHAPGAPEAGHRDGKDTAPRGATAPLWAGDSDGVQLRVRPGAGAERATATLPDGMRLELVSPGPAPAGQPASGSGADGKRTRPGDLRPQEAPADGDEQENTAVQREAANQPAELPALSRAETAERYGTKGADDHVGPRPGIVTRSGWGADESLREKQFLYTNTVKAAFVHHTATGNGYSCKEVPSIIRSMYRYHTGSLKWRDVGYNFFVDKCGTIYEGRAGGVARPVMGAHTYGFNSDTTGIALIGSHGSGAPTKEAVEGLGKLTAWKLGLHDRNPAGKTRLVSGGGKYKKGSTVTLNTVSGHRDGFGTACPGDKLYSELGSVRSLAAKLQGR